MDDVNREYRDSIYRRAKHSRALWFNLALGLWIVATDVSVATILLFFLLALWMFMYALQEENLKTYRDLVKAYEGREH